MVSVGDYNAYFEEDPMDILRAGNYNVLSTSGSYSYLFQGQLGSLDHAIISNTLNTTVTGIAKWNINSAEPAYLDYNDAIDDGANDDANPWASTYTVSPWRSSDHDPILIGFNFPVTLPVGLVDFTITKQLTSAKLNWITVQEKIAVNF